MQIAIPFLNAFKMHTIKSQKYNTMCTTQDQLVWAKRNFNIKIEKKKRNERMRHDWNNYDADLLFGNFQKFKSSLYVDYFLNSIVVQNKIILQVSNIDSVQFRSIQKKEKKQKHP